MNRIIYDPNKSKQLITGQKGLLTKMGANQNDTDKKRTTSELMALQYVKIFTEQRESQMINPNHK